jgi:putative colanic acid biosynthesis acetyltransferase WcaF
MRLKGYTTGGFQRGVPAWKEAAWLVVKSLFFHTALPWPSSLRAALLRAFGARVGERVVVRANVNISFPWRLTLGNDVWLGEEVMILSLAEVTVESDVCISQRAFLCTGSHRFDSPGFDLVVKPITVRRGSWIAAQAFIAPGVEIGAGSLVSASSVVLHEVPAGVLVRGNPAAVVKEWK